MNLLDEESILLRIGDIKLSDTYDTFGERKIVNEYEYNPLVNPKSVSFFDTTQLTSNVAHGDSREGTCISNKKTEILLTYGANRCGSNAQSMAIGYFDGTKYFFVDETFGDIYSEKPQLNSRNVIMCKSIWEYGEDDTTKQILFLGELIKKATAKEEKCFQELLSRINLLEDGFKKENLDNLRKREIFRRMREARKNRDREEER